MNKADNVVKKMMVDDRQLILKPIDGTKSKSSTGLIDPGLFDGTNTLHVKKDSGSNLWYFKYDRGGLPPVLKDQMFTGFKAAYKYAEDYFRKRNVEIKEVLD